MNNYSLAFLLWLCYVYNVPTEITLEVINMRTIFSDSEIIELHKSYMAGDSTNDLAKRTGCRHNSVIRNSFIRLGLPLRTVSEANILQAARAGASARAARAIAAQTARRGSK